MGDAPLPLHDDDLRFRLLVCADDLGFELADHEVAFDRIQRYPVRRALDDARLPRRHERRGDPGLAQGIREQESGRPLSDRAVRPEDRDPEAGQLAREIAELLRLANRTGLPGVDETDSVGLGELRELRVLAQVFVQARNDVQAILNRFAQDWSILLRDVSAERRHPTITVAGLGRSIASFRFANIGMAFGFPSEALPASAPALRRSL